MDTNKINQTVGELCVSVLTFFTENNKALQNK